MLFRTLVSVFAISGTVALAAPPVAETNGDFRLEGPMEAVLNGSHSYDPDGGALTYLWEQISGKTVNIVDPTSAIARAEMPEVCDPTGYTFRLTVTDAEGLTANKSVRVTVVPKPEPMNYPPRVMVGSDMYIVGPMTLALNGSRSYDPDSDPITFLWTQESGPAIGIHNSTNDVATVNFPAAIGRPIEYSFRLTVTDPMGLSAWDVMKVQVRPSGEDTNVPPEVTNPGTMNVFSEQKFTLKIYAKDDGPLSYFWKIPIGFKLIADRGASLDLEAPCIFENKTYDFVVTVSDGKYNVTEILPVFVVGLRPPPPQTTLRGSA